MRREHTRNTRSSAQVETALNYTLRLTLRPKERPQSGWDELKADATYLGYAYLGSCGHHRRWNMLALRPKEPQSGWDKLKAGDTLTYLGYAHSSTHSSVSCSGSEAAPSLPHDLVMMATPRSECAEQPWRS
jgi:hypothetical protein